jgi:hypothetical protein
MGWGMIIRVVGSRKGLREECEEVKGVEIDFGEGL